MLCNQCSKTILFPKPCSKCLKKFCSNACLERHKISHLPNKSKKIYSKPIIQKHQNQVYEKESPYITDGFIVAKIHYDKKYNIKNFNPVIFFNEPKIIGTGSYGKVILVKNKVDNKLYAIKHMSKKDLNSTLQSLNGIKQEINIQSRIYHPNIVRLLYVQEDNENYDLVMQYANGGSLFYYIRKKKYLCEKESFKFFIQIANAIYFLHLNDLIHRDIKPENILIYGENNVKLCDFGWCVRLEGKQRQTFCGTTEYMAPEIINYDEYSKSIDVWSLGILLYEMTHGYSPFKPNKKNFKSNEVIQNIRKHEIKFKKSISYECKELICHLLETDKEKRWKVEDIFNSKFVKKYEHIHYFIPKNEHLNKNIIENKINNENDDDGYISYNDENLVNNTKKLKSEKSQILLKSKIKLKELNSQNILTEDKKCEKFHTPLKDYSIEIYNNNKKNQRLNYHTSNLINNESKIKQEYNSTFNNIDYIYTNTKKLQKPIINLKNFQTLPIQKRKININLSNTKKKCNSKNISNLSNIIINDETNSINIDNKNDNYNSIIQISPSKRKIHIRDSKHITENSNLSNLKNKKSLRNYSLQNNISYKSCKDFSNINENSKSYSTNIKLISDTNEYNNQRNNLRYYKNSFANKKLTQSNIKLEKLSKSTKFPINNIEIHENITFRNDRKQENDNFNYEQDTTVDKRNDNNNDVNKLNKNSLIKLFNKSYSKIEILKPENIVILNKTYSKNFKKNKRIEGNIQLLKNDIIENEINSNENNIIQITENNYQSQQNIYKKNHRVMHSSRTPRNIIKKNLYNCTNPNFTNIYFNSTFYNVNKMDKKNSISNNINNISEKNIEISSNISDENLCIKNLDNIKYNKPIKEFSNNQHNITDLSEFDNKSFVKKSSSIRNLIPKSQRINYIGNSNKILYTEYSENGNECFFRNQNKNNNYIISDYTSKNNQNMINYSENTNYDTNNAIYNVINYMSPLIENKYIENKTNNINLTIKSYDVTPKKKDDKVKIIPYQLIKNSNHKNKIDDIY